MSEKYLHRADAPFGESVWQRIDEAVVGAARGQLSARRLLYAEGPYGLRLKSISDLDQPVEEESAAGGELAASAATPLALIQSGFRLGARDLAATESSGVGLTLGAAAEAAIACARREDALLFYGSKHPGTPGLLNAKGVNSLKLKSWSQVGAAADDIIKAATKLDQSGFHGPYALALDAARYNGLLRRYPDGNQTELDHARTIASDGVIKSAAIKSGGVLLATGRQYASIILGQDLATRFIGPAGDGYEFLVIESLALRLIMPASVCVLSGE